MGKPLLLSDALSDAAALGRSSRGGRVAAYIPQLASADPSQFSFAVEGTDGVVEAAGDTASLFTIQSIVKPFLFGLALERYGEASVFRRVGVEPTGQEFDSFTRIETSPNRPPNPMVNSGAIAIVDLLLSGESSVSEASESILSTFSELTGKRLVRDQSVFESELAHGARNRVIAHLMKHFGLLSGGVEDALEAYFGACAISVSCADLAAMAACLACGGRKPGSDRVLFSPSVTRTVLTVMTTCGMYDASGRFAWEVGLPAKSGVSGGVLAVLPGRCGAAVYSPRLDASGNSVAGWSTLRRFARRIDGHFLLTPRARQAKTAPDLIEAAVRRAYQIARAETGGRPADYLPRSVNPPLAIAVFTVDGQEHLIGDCNKPVSIQAMANPLALAHAFSCLGEERMRRLVGEEPSGNPFHAIIIDERRRRPFNAMGNAGAIAIASANMGITGFDPEAWVGSLIGEHRRLVIDQDVLAAERSHAHRNYAIASRLREVGVLDNAAGAVDMYLQQCSVAVTASDLARIGSTLANSGVRVADGQRVLKASVATKVLTVMYTCGMHDQSGQFAMDVGIPAKSGVSGGILAIVPGVMGIAVLSPMVDPAGTSVPGRAALKSLSHFLSLSIFGE